MTHAKNSGNKGSRSSWIVRTSTVEQRLQVLRREEVARGMQKYYMLNMVTPQVFQEDMTDRGVKGTSWTR
jgi:hypothetical protein